MSQSELQPIEPETAIELYLNHREPELADKTMQNITQHLTRFQEWCEKEGIDNLNELTGRKLHEYRLWRQDGVAQTTLSINLSSLRVFLKWCQSVDGVPDGLYETVILPTRNRSEEARDEMLNADHAEEMLQWLRTYKYATRTHALLEVMWHTGIRKGTLRSLDVGDFHPRNKTLETNHRPETDTPLKNRKQGERVIALSDHVVDVLNDYLDVHRREKKDDNGRNPLFTTRYGRIGGTAIKRAVYRVTRPCQWGSCPHNRDPDECDAMIDQDSCLCPSSVSPHPVRRGSITHHLLNDVPDTAVSDRCDVSKDVLDHHYDERTEYEKAETRRKYIDGL